MAHADALASLAFTTGKRDAASRHAQDFTDLRGHLENAKQRAARMVREGLGRKARARRLGRRVPLFVEEMS